jgi:septin family protein
MSPEQSDFVALRDAVLDTHLKVSRAVSRISSQKALRSTTREVLYEQYRTERLLENQKTRGACV